MTLNSFAAERRLQIFEDLRAGNPPRAGSFSEPVLKEGRAKGQPQMGPTRYKPAAIVFEFIYPDPKSSSTILAVTLTPPERIVFLPVPPWVVESIWQGTIDGSYHFESEALEMMRRFQEELAPEANKPWFEPRQPTHRE